MQASKLPPVFDRAWESIGGGPADLFFPEDFMGTWEVSSTLIKVETPLGPDYIPDPRVRLQLRANLCMGLSPSPDRSLAAQQSCIAVMEQVAAGDWSHHMRKHLFNAHNYVHRAVFQLDPRDAKGTILLG